MVCSFVLYKKLTKKPKINKQIIYILNHRFINSKKMINKVYDKINSKYRISSSEDFKSIKTNFGRYNHISSNPDVDFEIERLFRVVEFDNKDAVRATRYREEGNLAYKQKDLNEALLKYNLSLQYSPLDENLALAYANRSAIFFQKRLFPQCLSDIELALKNGYPDNLKLKLYERKAECYANTGRLKEAIEFIEGLLKTPLEMDTKTKEGLEKKLKQCKDTYEANKLDSDDEDLTDLAISTKNDFKPGKLLLNSSEAIALDYSNDRGNHFKTLKVIDVGKTVVKEPAYASVLLSSFIKTNCYECMLRLNIQEQNVAYCEQCSQVIYCSEECRAKSWKNHHSIECNYLNYIVNKSEITHMEHLAMRIVLKAGFKYLNSIKYELTDYEDRITVTDTEQYIIPRDKVYDSLDYMNIFRLITHASHREPRDLLRRTLVSCYLVKILQKANFFPPESTPDDYNFIGGLLLRHNQSISCNAHEISELKFDKHSIGKSSSHGIGAGIYATLSIFNHSCDPHVTRNFDGTTCVLRAIKTIKAGEEILDNYGVLYATNEISDRRMKLRDQYFFDCDCEPCKFEWPLYDQIKDAMEYNKFICNTCQEPIEDDIDSIKKDCCKKRLKMASIEKSNLQKSKTDAQKALKSLFDSKFGFNLEGACQAFTSYLSLMDTYIETRPFRDYNNSQEALKQVFNLMSKNKFMV